MHQRPIDAQRSFHHLNVSRSGASQIHVRMALHRGTITHRRSASGEIDVYGSVVNYASRLIAQSAGGQIVLSTNVLEDLQSPAVKHSAAKAEALLKHVELVGKQSFKGVQGEQDVYSVRPEAIAE